MASVQDRLKLKRETCDTWSTREQLCLASSVLKSGDQNWISVSRSLRPFAEKEALRPPDWFSQKSCAIQYAILLENADTPKRKKRESGETTGESIVRRLTQERITELGQILAFQRDEYQQLKNEVNLLKSGNISDEKLQKMWQAIEQEEREAEQKARAHSAWLAKRQQKNESQSTSRKPVETQAETPELQELQPETEEDRKNRGGRSPLLTSLLKSPSPTTQMQNPSTAPSTATSTSPTIASLLGANTKTLTPQISTAASSQLHHFITSTLAPSVTERPSAGAPTLSMLLELPSNLPRGSIANMQTSQNSLNNSPRTKIGNHVATSITNSVPVGESVENIIEQIDDVIGKDNMPEVIDKDEINEIIGDIEELIKEEITKSPKGSDTGIIEGISASVEPNIVRDVDETASETSGNGEVIGEIDQSSSSIAEIIGTAIETEVKGIVQGIENVPEEEDKPGEECSMIIEEVKEDNEEMEEEKTEMNEDKMEEETSKEIDEKNEAEGVEDVFKPEDSTPEPDPGHNDDDKIEEEEKNDNTGDKTAGEDEKVTEEKSEDDKPRDEEDKSGIDEEKCDDESGENKEATEDSEEPTGEPEDKQTDDKSESKESPGESEEKPDSADDAAGDEKTEAPEGGDTPEVKDSDPDPKSPEDKESKEDDSKESEDEFKDCRENQEDYKSSEDSNEKIEDLNDDKSKGTEEESPRTDVDEELEPPVLPNELEELPLDKKEKEEEDEGKSDDKNDGKEVEIDGNVDEGVGFIKEEPMDEETEAKCEENDLKVEKDEKDDKEDKEEIKKEDVEVKKEEVSAADDTDVEEEESSMTKLPAGRAIKTYSKKQNAVVDSEPETETSDTAEYKIWKKSILLHYSRLATHKYASLFLRPITEDQAPGYRSVVFRSMDLSTIKKNIDNGKIRSNMEFQRDVMLMFQNAVMYNKSDSFVYKMAVNMQEECLQSMQILVEATGEGAFRRETRTAASSSSETSESSIIKRKRSLVTPSPLDTDSPRMKKRRKSEND